MRRRRRRKAVPVPLLIAEMMVASCETIAHRTWMMARGACSPAEYRRMVAEKVEALRLSGRAMARGGVAAALAPWHRRARANAKRLRKT